MKCPICGKLVPPSKRAAGRQRKYCSTKCKCKASYVSAIKRGYKRKKKFRKICPVCSKEFFTCRRDRIFYCSRECANNAIAMKRSGKTKSERLQAIRDRRERKRLALERCRETAPITIEERGGIVTEWRGQRCIGCHAVDHVRHS